MNCLKIFMIIATLTLAGCAGGMSFDQHLRQLEGKPINDAELMLKHKPTGEYQELTGATVYVWQDSYSESIFGDNVTRKGGYQIGSAMDNGSALIWSGIQFHTCVIRAKTTDGIIRKITMEGNPGGCETIYGWKKQPLGKNSYSM